MCCALSIVLSLQVPPSVTVLDMKLWGAGGGAGYPKDLSAPTQNNQGGSGGFTSVSLAVTPGEVLDVVVAAGGAGGSQPVCRHIRVVGAGWGTALATKT